MLDDVLMESTASVVPGTGELSRCVPVNGSAV